MNIFITVALYAVVFLLLATGFYLLLRSSELKDAAQKNLQKIMSDLHARDDIRVSEIEKARRKYGTTSGSDVKQSIASKFYEHIDNLLIYSETSLRYEKLNASVYLILSILLLLGGTLIGTILTGSLAIGLILGFLLVLYPYVHMSSKATLNYKKTEEQLEDFINSVGANSVYSADLLTILEMTAAEQKQPIKDAVFRATNTARVKGDSNAFVWRLTREIEHPLFVNFIRNLDICSKVDANYKNVAKDFAEQARQQLGALKTLRAIRANEKNEIMLIMVVSVVIDYMICSYAEMSFFQAIRSMMGTPMGMLILLVEFFIYAATIVYLIVGGKK